jgi:serine/threonine protein kinase
MKTILRPLGAGQWLGDFRLVCELGRGSGARVWGALWLGSFGFVRPVVLKLVPLAGEFLAGVRSRLAHESRVASLAPHPNVRAVQGLVHCDGWLVSVFPYAGLSLEELLYLSPGRQLSAEVVVALGLQLCEGLEGMHHAATGGFAHCDVSPDNVLLNRSGEVWLADLGLAQPLAGVLAMTPEPTKDCAELKHWGKPAYAAPELLRGTAASPRSDVFSACCVLYEALAGVGPFTGASDASTALRVLSGGHGALELLRPDVPPGLAEAVQQGLSARPDARPHSAAALAEALGRALPSAPWQREITLASCLNVCARARLDARDRVFAEALVGTKRRDAAETASLTAPHGAPSRSKPGGMTSPAEVSATATSEPVARGEYGGGQQAPVTFLPISRPDSLALRWRATRPGRLASASAIALGLGLAWLAFRPLGWLDDRAVETSSLSHPPELGVASKPARPEVALTRTHDMVAQATDAGVEVHARPQTLRVATTPASEQTERPRPSPIQVPAQEKSAVPRPHPATQRPDRSRQPNTPGGQIGPSRSQAFPPADRVEEPSANDRGGLNAGTNHKGALAERPPPPAPAVRVIDKDDPWR